MTRFDPKPVRVVYLALAASAVACLFCLWSAWCEFPGYTWNEARLAPAFALREGINPYPLIGGGPLFTWIYGPIGILINLPATFASSVAGALHLASLVNFVVLISPLALIFFSSNELRARTPAIRWLALCIAVLLIPRPNLIFQVADHAAIAFGLLSCWYLARLQRPDTIHLQIAALFCALGIWSKQIAVFLVVAQLAYLLLTDNSRSVLPYIGWVVVLNLVSLGLSVVAFGWANLWLNLVAIPGQLPWVDNFGARLTSRIWPIAAQIGLPCIGVSLLGIAKRWPSRGTQSGRFFLLTVLVFAAMLPVGFIAFVKIGGDTNLFHSWDYLLPGAMVAWLAAERFSTGTRNRVLVVVACAIFLRRADVFSIPRNPIYDHFKAAERLMAISPHRIWFPRDPLITFYADNKLWHSEDGVQTRFLANYGIREADFRRYLPPDLYGFAYPSSMEPPFCLQLLSEFDQTVKQGYWTLHVRSVRQPAKTEK